MKVYSVVRIERDEKGKPAPRIVKGIAYDKNGKVRFRMNQKLPAHTPCVDCGVYAAVTTTSLCNYCADRPVMGMTQISRRLNELYPDPKNRPSSSNG